MRAHRNQAEMIERRQLERYVASNQQPGCERCERDALCGDCERLVEDAERDALNEAHDAPGLLPDDEPHDAGCPCAFCLVGP